MQYLIKSLLVKVYLAILILGLIPISKGWAQSLTQAQLAEKMQHIYRNYDSIPFLSFDVKFSYSSDTLLGKYKNEQLSGTYTMAGKKAKYRLGNIDFMQNDSFFIAVYNDDQTIIVGAPQTNNIGTKLPLRQMIDSLVNNYFNHYAVTFDSVGTDTSVINFEGADSLAQLKKFKIMYDNRNYMLSRLSYEFVETVALDSADIYTQETYPQDQQLVIQFSNYRFDNYDLDLYNQSNYIYFDQGVCKPVGRYAGFKIYNSRPIPIQED